MYARDHYDEYGHNVGYYSPFVNVELKQMVDGWQNEEIKKGLIELFKDSPYIEYIMDYVGPIHGTLMELSWEADSEDPHWIELGHDYCYVSLNGILGIEKNGDQTIINFT